MLRARAPVGQGLGGPWLLDGHEAFPLQALEHRERRRQQFTLLAVVPTPTCDRRLDGGDQELGRRPSVTRFHRRAAPSASRLNRAACPQPPPVLPPPSPPPAADGGTSGTSGVSSMLRFGRQREPGAINANGTPASVQPIAFASSLTARRYFRISSEKACRVASGSPAS